MPPAKLNIQTPKNIGRATRQIKQSILLSRRAAQSLTGAGWIHPVIDGPTLLSKAPHPDVKKRVEA